MTSTLLLLWWKEVLSLASRFLIFSSASSLDKRYAVYLADPFWTTSSNAKHVDGI